MINRINHWSSGIILVILIVIKPFAIVFGLYYLMNRNWKVLKTAFASGIVVLLITGLFFGFEIFRQFFISPPTSRIPESVHYEGVNKSLLAALFRFQHNHTNVLDLPSVKPIFLVVSAVLLTLTLIASKKLLKYSQLLSFAIYIPFVLIIYPNTLTHYSIFIIPVILALYCEIEVFKKTALGLLLFLFMYFAGSVNLFYMNIFTYLTLLIVAFKTQWNLNILNIKHLNL